MTLVWPDHVNKSQLKVGQLCDAGKTRLNPDSLTQASEQMWGGVGLTPLVQPFSGFNMDTGCELEVI